MPRLNIRKTSSVAGGAVLAALALTCSVTAGAAQAVPSAGTTNVKPTVGLIPGVSLSVHRGNLVVTKSGTKLFNLHITGELDILGNVSHITVADVLVDGEIDVESGTQVVHGKPVYPQSVYLVHVESHGFRAQGYDGLTINASKIHDDSEGTLAQFADETASVGGVTEHWPANHLVLDNSWLYGLNSSTQHGEDVHLLGTTGAAFRNDIFDATTGSMAVFRNITAAFYTESFGGVGCSAVLLDHDSFYGGGYFQLRISSTASTVTNDAFHSYESPDHTIGGIPEGPPSYFTPAFPYFPASGNTLDGKSIRLPGSRT